MDIETFTYISYGIIGASILLIIGTIIYIIYAHFVYVDDVEATITDIFNVRSYDFHYGSNPEFNSKPVPHYRLKYVLDKEYESSIQIMKHKEKIGDKITVKYNKNKPYKVREAGYKWQIFIIVIASLFAGGYWVLLEILKAV